MRSTLGSQEEKSHQSNTVCITETVFGITAIGLLLLSLQGPGIEVFIRLSKSTT